jgi:hypothetical protein
MKRSRTLPVFFLASITMSLIVDSATPINARPCGDDVFSKVGCWIDPSNPKDNGGGILTREQIDKVKNQLRQTGEHIDKNVTQPVIVRPIVRPVIRTVVKATDWLAKPAELWGESGRAGMYAAKAKIESDNLSVPKEPIPEMFKPALRQKYGDIVDRVKIVYSANLLTNICIFQNKVCVDLGNTAAQAFGDTVYIKAAKPDPQDVDYEPLLVDGKYQFTTLRWDRVFLNLLAHEIKHVQQYRDAGSTGRFGYEYFKSFKEVNQSYHNINKEVEASEHAEEFLAYKCSVKENNCTK